MKVDLRYRGRSGLALQRRRAILKWVPNLARDEVAFDGRLKHPVRFREAVGALHDVVVSDLRFRPRGREAYGAWLQAEREAEAAIRREAADAGRRAALEELKDIGPPPDLDARHAAANQRYWKARTGWWHRLMVTDPALWRKLMPLDPVVTVAPDAVLFECFSKDESSYGCLSVDRDAFEGAGDAQLGVTNVDYSQALYERFQSMRSYRETRFVIDPGGFGVQVEGHADVREETIDLPSSWLRGFGQLQAALSLPARRVELPRAAVYAVLRHLHLNREKTGPRSIRFELTPGRPPTLVLEPWGTRIPCRGAPYGGAREETVRVWGRRRLALLGRLLPLVDRLEVRLLGSGLPSVWVADLGDMRFTLALSGWTRNNWTGATTLDLLAGLAEDASLEHRVAKHLQRHRTASLDALAGLGTRRAVTGALYGLAKRGQVLYDVPRDAARWRSILPVALSDEVLGPEPAEKVAGFQLARDGQVVNAVAEDLGDRRLIRARVGSARPEVLLDPDGRMIKAQCSCQHHFTYGLRAGPCRHVLALTVVRAHEHARSRMPGLQS